ncbi:MAG: hypothetical protein M1816_002099 [Peltula sp. TS41687]|nr:MAG: hypothetical protein M1816_002099 [Peltula sp. TS41687]
MENHRGEKIIDALKNTGPVTTYDEDGQINNGFGKAHGDQILSPAQERNLKLRMDLRILPFLSILYLLAFLDRVNIGNASVFNLPQDLKLKNVQFNTALTIFFVPYILFEIPSNIILRRVKPNVWLASCMFLFGLDTTMQGLVKNYGGLLTTRFFLGLLETGIFPGCFYIIGMWYTRSEAQRRFTFFFGSTSLAGAFGGLLASAIGKMSGLRGYSGWRWIFILEGVLTCVVAFALFFVLPTFPEEAKWITEEERAFIEAKQRREQGDSAVHRPIVLKDIVRVFTDYKIILGGFMYLGLIVAAYGYAYFSPTIIRSYGYSPIQTQLHSVPPYAAAFVLSMIIAYLSDKARHRFLFAMFPTLLAIAGFAILLTVHTRRNVQYAALFLVAMGTFSAMPVIICWFNMNLGGHHRRSVGVAWQIGFGNIGGIIATYSFVAKDQPRYKKGYSIGIAFVCLSAVASILYFFACRAQNNRRDRATTDLGLSDYEKSELGDMSPDYRYLL